MSGTWLAPDSMVTCKADSSAKIRYRDSHGEPECISQRHESSKLNSTPVRVGLNGFTKESMEIAAYRARTDIASVSEHHDGHRQEALASDSNSTRPSANAERVDGRGYSNSSTDASEFNDCASERSHPQWPLAAKQETKGRSREGSRNTRRTLVLAAATVIFAVTMTGSGYGTGGSSASRGWPWRWQAGERRMGRERGRWRQQRAGKCMGRRQGCCQCCRPAFLPDWREWSGERPHRALHALRHRAVSGWRCQRTAL